MELVSAMTRGLGKSCTELEGCLLERKLTQLRQKEHNPTSIIFQRMQSEAALRELERKEAHLRLARNVRMVWSERTFLVRLSVLGLILGLLVAFSIPARYTSTTRLMPPDNPSGSSLAMTASIAASVGGATSGGLLGLKSASDFFVGILGTRTVQDQIIEQFDLKRVYGLRGMEGARLTLASRTGISVDPKSQIITITVTDHSPQRAQGMAKGYVDQLNRLVSELSTSSARRERIFLEGRLAQVNQDLETAEKEFSQFASKNSTIDIKEQGKAIVEAAASVQGRLMIAQSELEELRQIYSDSSVRVRAVKARIAELQSQLAKFGGKDQTGPETGPADQYPSIRKLPLLGVTYADLYRRTKVQEAVYEVLTQEYELAKVQEAKEIPIVKVVDPADMPEKKRFPPRLLIGISTMFLAFIGGIVFLLGSKSWHEKNPHDLSKAIATEIWTDLKEKRVLNSVNGAHEPETDSSSSLHRRRSVFSYLGLNNAAHNGNGFSSSSNHIPEKELSDKEK
jgi:capsule polysaccharide export protein KpsE/RkpR